MENLEFLRKEYLKLEDAFLKACGPEELDDFRENICALVLRVWSEELEYHEDYSQALAAVYGEEELAKDDIVKRMDALRGSGVQVMAGFSAIHLEGLGESFASDLYTFLTDMSFIGGDCTVKEAGVIENIRKTYAGFGSRFIGSREENPDTVSRNYLDMSIFDLSGRLNRAGLRSSSTAGTGRTTEPEQKTETAAEKTAAEKAVAEKAAAEKKAAEEEKPEETVDELLAEMDALVGLDAVKKDIHAMINFIRVCKLREERGMKAPELSHHMVFSGNPGTGKTTVARMLARLYKAIGVLKEGQLVEVDRSGLIAGYQGQTAIKTQEVIQSALGGVLFIDEAYALVESDNDTYGKECIATILKAMEDHRDELIVIVAGYDDLMEKFIDSNPGLKSRFNKYIHFPDYTGEEMEKIFLLQCRSNGYELEPEARGLLRAVFDDMYDTRDENFGNGRTVRNTFEKIINCQATRLAAITDITDEQLALLTVEDVKAGLDLAPEEMEAPEGSSEEKGEV